MTESSRDSNWDTNKENMLWAAIGDRKYLSYLMKACSGNLEGVSLLILMDISLELEAATERPRKCEAAWTKE